MKIALIKDCQKFLKNQWPGHPYKFLCTLDIVLILTFIFVFYQHLGSFSELHTNFPSNRSV